MKQIVDNMCRFIEQNNILNYLIYEWSFDYNG